MKTNEAELLERTLAGTVFVLAILVALWLGPWVVASLFFIFAMLGLHECYNILSNQPSVLPRYTGGYITGALIYSFFFLVTIGFSAIEIFWWLVPMVVAIVSTDLIYLEKFSLTHFGATTAGWVYVVIPFSLIPVLAQLNGDYDKMLPLGFFILLWTNDTMAYVVGRLLGRHKLFEKVSPKKTLEGFAGGLLFTLAAGWLLSVAWPQLELRHWLITATIISVFGTIGDLVESHMKRGVGIKDSGNVIPGHGGVLDRFDGMLLSLPLVVFYLKLFVYT